MDKLYAAAILAQRNTPTGVTVHDAPVALKATNKQEALGFALEAAKMEFPEKDGWYGDQANVVEIPGYVQEV